MEVQGLEHAGNGVLPHRRRHARRRDQSADGTGDEKQPIPGQGWFAACTDPDGNNFSLFQNDPSVTMETMAAHQGARA